MPAPLPVTPKRPIVVCITGAAGQIGYSLIPLVASGEMFGMDQPVELRLLDIAPMMEPLKGTVMEIHDCAYPLLTSVKYGSDPKEMFKDLDVGLFVGGFPRKAGMERKDLIARNSSIFKEHGAALNEVAKPTTKVVVVANPANTNCLILSTNAPKIPRRNFTCLTRLDHNRALVQLAEKAKVPVADVRNVIIWGNHSSTQYPDVTYALIQGKRAVGVIVDNEYLHNAFISTIQKRGAEIIAARKASSAMSAAKAVKDHMRSWFLGTKDGEWVSMGVMTEGNTYGLDQNLCFSLPCKCLAFDYQVVTGLAWDEFSKEKIRATEKELQDERKEALGI